MPGSNRQPKSALIDEGTALLGPARLGKQQGIRVCVTNYRTTRADIDLIVDRLAEIARGFQLAPAD